MHPLSDRMLLGIILQTVWINVVSDTVTFTSGTEMPKGNEKMCYLAAVSRCKRKTDHLRRVQNDRLQKKWGYTTTR